MAGINLIGIEYEFSFYAWFITFESLYFSWWRIKVLIYKETNIFCIIKYIQIYLIVDSYTKLNLIPTKDLSKILNKIENLVLSIPPPF